MAASLRRARRARRRARWSPPPRGPWSAELASLVAVALAEVRATLRALPAGLAAEELSPVTLRARRATELVRCALARRWRSEDEFDLWAVALAVGASMRVEVRAPLRPFTVRGHRADAARLLRALFDLPGASVTSDDDAVIVRASRAPPVDAMCARRAASLGLSVEATSEGARLSRAP
ncbi:MAG: hypothetical protein R3A52_05820 [Polyangiales bacterium]